MPLPLSSVRSLFPHHREQIYLNHAAISPFSLPVKAALLDYLEDRHLGGIENHPKVTERAQELRASLALLIGSQQPEQIALLQNTSTGFGLLATGLDWKPGQRILLNSMEFPANIYPFLALKQQGVEVDIVPARQGKVEVEDLAAAIRPETRLLSISWVQFLSGQRMDLKALGALCREHKLIFSVDGIQGLGAASLNVEELGIDFLVSGGHKWLMGAQGTGFAYIAPQLMSQLQMRMIGWLSVQNAWDILDYQLLLREDAARYELGTPNAMGQAALFAALEVFQRFEQNEITEQVLDLSSFLVSELQKRQLKLLTPHAPKERLGIVTFEHPEAPRLFAALEAQQIRASLREESYLRFSPHFYNSLDELETTLNVLDRALK